MSDWRRYVRYVTVSSLDASLEASAPGTLPLSEQAELCAALRASWGELIIQRPDGYLGYRGTLARGAEALEYIAQLLGNTAAPAAAVPRPLPFATYRTPRARSPKLGAAR
jgi:hypothetical protein